MHKIIKPKCEGPGGSMS